MTDFLSDISRLHKYAEGLHSLLDESLAGASDRVEGSDRRYAVLVVLASDGAVESIRVDPDWKRNLRPEMLGGAIMEAYNAAAAQYVRAWTTALTESDWEARADRLRERTDAEPTSESDARPYPRDLSQVRPRDPAAIVAEVNAVLDSLGDPSGPAGAATGTGTAGFGKLTVAVSPHELISCVVDPMWASQRTGEELTEALGTALTAARADLAEAVAKGPTGRLNRLLDEALANLHHSQS
jgi:DNA-binding protein YbaB